MKIAAVIVTYNRLELLTGVLDTFELMTVKPDVLVIVNNASTDGTTEYLTSWNNKTHLNVVILNLPENIGGSGGFHSGLKKAIEYDVDWIWLSDDDAFPDIDVFEKFNCHIERCPIKNVGAYCTAVINNGVYDLMHRRSLVGGVYKTEKLIMLSDYKKEFFEIDLFSYVGAIIKKDVLLELGLTERDYFIWRDDTEHSMRISKKYKIICLPELAVRHDTLPETEGLNWKIYYGLRNKFIMYKKHYKITSLIMYTKFLVRNIIRGLLGRLTRAEFRLYFAAFKDSLFNNLGVNKEYYPGKKLK